jgi:hypothetical protein
MPYYVSIQSKEQVGTEKNGTPISPPPATPIPFAAYQVEILEGCSAPFVRKMDFYMGLNNNSPGRVYHRAVTIIKAGSAMASAAPPRTRRAARDAKLWHAA